MFGLLLIFKIRAKQLVILRPPVPEIPAISSVFLVCCYFGLKENLWKATPRNQKQTQSTFFGIFSSGGWRGRWGGAGGGEEVAVER